MQSSTLFTRLLTANEICAKSYSKSRIFQFIKANVLKKATFKTCTISKAQEKIEVENYSLNMEKVGNGPHPILCLPGSLGFIQADFSPQLQKLNRDKFTIVAWDPPGYGKSRPPDRDVVSGPLKNLPNDARLAHGLMKKLGYDKFSILGWSDGAVTAIFLYNLFPNSVQKMVLNGGQAFLNEKDLVTSTKYRDINTWSEKMKKPMIDMYGEEYFQKNWAAWMDAYIKLYHEGGDICKDKLSSIKCPTFVIHGAKDVMVHVEHSHYLHQHIKNSKLHIMEKGGHNLHLRYADEFNAMVEEFYLKE